MVQVAQLIKRISHNPGPALAAPVLVFNEFLFEGKAVGVDRLGALDAFSHEIASSTTTLTCLPFNGLISL